MTDTNERRARGFTLIELLVSVAIIAGLAAILLPSLRQARATSKVVTCASHLRQLGLGVHTYAIENDGFIPRGPKPAYPFDFSGNGIATNQLWIGTEVWGYPPANPLQHNGLGSMLKTVCPDPGVYFCPDDDTYNLTREKPKIGTDANSYGSYIYRQLDRLGPKAGAGLLDRLGSCEVAGVRIAVEALAMDTNSLGSGQFRHTNHAAKVANVLFRDGSVRRFGNRKKALALPEDAFPNPVDILGAIDQMLTNADYAYRTASPDGAPRIDVEP